MIGWGLVLILGLVMAYVRLAPSDPARWDKPVTASESRNFPGGAIRVIPARPGILSDLEVIARATPRTSVLAGSVQAGRITFVTRSKWWGFPDYTTAEVVDGQLRLFPRLRFGRRDLGVNRARLESWLSEL